MHEMDFIAAVGSALFSDRKQTTIFSAMVLWHRFYIRRSLRCHAPAAISVACLLLSSKACETLAHMHLFVRAYLQRTEGLSDVDQRTAVSGRRRWRGPLWRGLLTELPPCAVQKAVEARETLIAAERAVLDALEYDVDVELPATAAIQAACDAFEAPEVVRRQAPRAIASILRSELPLRFPACVLAEAAVFVAFRVSGLPLPPPAAVATAVGAAFDSGSSGGSVRVSAADVEEVMATLQAHAATAAAAAAARGGGRGGGGGVPPLPRVPAGSPPPPPAEAPAPPAAAASLPAPPLGRSATPPGGGGGGGGGAG